MCGIIGYTGEGNTQEILLKGLRRLEYRGYDSAGIALAQRSGILIHKQEGRVTALEKLLSPAVSAKAGIGHTRWATHGKPDEVNAHPHRSGRVVLVHNGIIENEQFLRQELSAAGQSPVSETDTELIAMLLNRLYEGDPLTAIRRTAERLEGSYALGILFEDRPGELYALAKDSPLIVGQGDGESFIASDIPAISEHIRDYWLLKEGEIAILTAAQVVFRNFQGRVLQKKPQTVAWQEQAAEKGGYRHFMAKEIAEQPEALRNTIERYCKDGVFLKELKEEFLFDSLRIVGCGSAYHAGLMGKHLIEGLARCRVTVEQAGEFRYGNPILRKTEPVLVISQSGETADSLAALRLAKEQGIPTIGIVNVRESALAREADTVLYTEAGPEISVATTKAYSCQVALLYLLALRLAEKHLSPAVFREKCRQSEQLPRLVQEALKQEPACRRVAERLRDAEHLFFIGRGQDYFMACEASLKMKEITYIHSEAYAAGELKHGTISLIEEGTPVLALMTESDLFSKTAANIKEVRARGARVICITHHTVKAEGLADEIIRLPPCTDFTAPLPGAVLTQLLAYHAAVARGNEVDQPRNLAKSVTVE
ncbi:MAG: glutamine--fructose-6-phosphate transaminase (isomerizing) [Clostridia bacterium]|nr:glutamine--fructose-6-phosphate transaminase (isomerizing) [Clostridia bacterium]